MSDRRLRVASYVYACSGYTAFVQDGTDAKNVQDFGKKTGPINSTLFTVFTNDPTQECKSVNKLQRVVFPDNPVLLTRLSWARLVYVLEYF